MHFDQSVQFGPLLRRQKVVERRVLCAAGGVVDVQPRAVGGEAADEGGERDVDVRVDAAARCGVMDVIHHRLRHRAASVIAPTPPAAHEPPPAAPVRQPLAKWAVRSLAETRCLFD